MCHPRRAVEVTEHRIYKGWCTGCQKWHEAPVIFPEQVVGQGRIGVRLASMIAYLRTVMRLPLRQLREVLQTLHGMSISLAELVELLHRITEYAQPVLEGLKGEIRASPAIQADETGWREDGSNGYIWSNSTPTVRYYEYHHSRAGEVIKQLIGADYRKESWEVISMPVTTSIKVSINAVGSHFLRAIHDLKKLYPHDEVLLTWAKDVKAVYEQAVAWAEEVPDKQSSPHHQRRARVAQQHAFEQQLWTLCLPYVRNALSTTYLMRTSRTIFTGTLRVRGGTWSSRPQQSGPAQCPPSGYCSQNQWRDTQPQGITDAHGLGLSLRHLDGSTPEVSSSVSPS